MRVIPALALAGSLTMFAACDTSAPYSNVIDTTGRGVGFSDYAQYLRAQEELSRIRRAQAAQGQSMPMASAASAPAPQATQIGQEAVAAIRGAAPGALTVGTNAQTAASAQQVATQTARPPVAAAPMPQPSMTQSAIPQHSPTQPQPAQTPIAQPAAAPAAAGVSEQGFTPQPFGTPQQNRLVERDFVPQVRVTEAELAQGSGGPNLFVYALSTQHNVGEVRYNRTHPMRWRRWEAACARFPSQDLAQEAFLAAGGPQNDPNHLDPDGDGFACWWDPAPFRQAARAARARQ